MGAGLHHPAQNVKKWLSCEVALLHRVALGLYMVMRRMSSRQSRQDVDVLGTVCEVLTSILELPWYTAGHVPAGIPPLMMLDTCIGFREQILLEFGDQQWRRACEVFSGRNGRCPEAPV